MTLLKLKPWRADRLSLFDHSLFGTLFDELKEEERVYWQPVVDVAETEHGYEYKAELPGLSKKEVKVTVKDNILAIEGEKTVDRKDKKREYYYTERLAGTFKREFVLPKYVQTDKLKAEYADGVLTVTIPKAEEAKPREIAIQ